MEPDTITDAEFAFTIMFVWSIICLPIGIFIVINRPKWSDRWKR